MNDKIARMIFRLTELDAALEEMQPFLQDKYPCIFSDGTVGYDEPYDPEIIKSLTATFLEHRFSKTYEHIFTEDGTLLIEFRRGEVDFLIYFRPKMEGSVCKLTKIGEETIIKPIYEVTCLDA